MTVAADRTPIFKYDVDAALGLEHYQHTAVDIRRRLETAQPNNNKRQRDLIWSLALLGMAWLATDTQQAWTVVLDDGFGEVSRLLQTDPKNTEWLRYLALTSAIFAATTFAAARPAAGGVCRIRRSFADPEKPLRHRPEERPLAARPVLHLCPHGLNWKASSATRTRPETFSRPGAGESQSRCSLLFRPIACSPTRSPKLPDRITNGRRQRHPLRLKREQNCGVPIQAIGLIRIHGCRAPNSPADGNYRLGS